MTPFVADRDFTLYVGDARAVLRELPAESVDCCVTSPPYWGLRDYGTDGQIGLEDSPEAFVSELVTVFREVRRVLAPHGTLWLNLGDSYNAHDGQRKTTDKAGPKQLTNAGSPGAPSRHVSSLKPKDLVGIPWRVAFALQADGWYLRADIVWAKPNPMPESVTDRPTKAHEYVFLLSKQPRYFFDQEAVRESAEWARWGDQTNAKHEGSGSAAGWIGAKSKSELTARKSDAEGVNGRNVQATGAEAERRDQVGSSFNNNPRLRANVGRNIRSVWEIATQPYPDAHFATFPEALPERCIKAGTPLSVCVTCGEPRVRIVDVSPMEIDRSSRTHAKGQTRSSGTVTKPRESTTTGFTDCGHDNWRTGVVLDPFMGSGTTALVARRLGRKCVGIELNEQYAQLAARRLQQLSLLAEGAA